MVAVSLDGNNNKCNDEMKLDFSPFHQSKRGEKKNLLIILWARNVFFSVLHYWLPFSKSAAIPCDSFFFHSFSLYLYLIRIQFIRLWKKCFLLAFYGIRMRQCNWMKATSQLQYRTTAKTVLATGTYIDAISNDWPLVFFSFHFKTMRRNPQTKRTDSEYKRK